MQSRSRRSSSGDKEISSSPPRYYRALLDEKQDGGQPGSAQEYFSGKKLWEWNFLSRKGSPIVHLIGLEHYHLILSWKLKRFYCNDTLPVLFLMRFKPIDKNSSTEYYVRSSFTDVILRGSRVIFSLVLSSVIEVIEISSKYSHSRSGVPVRAAWWWREFGGQADPSIGGLPHQRTERAILISILVPQTCTCCLNHQVL